MILHEGYEILSCTDNIQEILRNDDAEETDEQLDNTKTTASTIKLPKCNKEFTAVLKQPDETPPNFAGTPAHKWKRLSMARNTVQGTMDAIIAIEQTLAVGKNKKTKVFPKLDDADLRAAVKATIELGVPNESGTTSTVRTTIASTKVWRAFTDIVSIHKREMARLILRHEDWQDASDERDKLLLSLDLHWENESMYHLQLTNDRHPLHPENKDKKKFEDNKANKVKKRKSLPPSDVDDSLMSTDDTMTPAQKSGSKRTSERLTRLTGDSNTPANLGERQKEDLRGSVDSTASVAGRMQTARLRSNASDTGTKDTVVTNAAMSLAEAFDLDEWMAVHVQMQERRKQEGRDR